MLRAVLFAFFLTASVSNAQAFREEPLKIVFCDGETCEEVSLLQLQAFQARANRASFSSFCTFEHGNQIRCDMKKKLSVKGENLNE